AIRLPPAQSMYQRPVATVSLQALQQTTHMSLALADLVGGLPLGDQPLPCFLQCDQPVAILLLHEKCSRIHPSSLDPSIGHFYLARLGHYHLALTFPPFACQCQVEMSYSLPSRN